MPLNLANITQIGTKDGLMVVNAVPVLGQQGAWVLSGQVIDTAGHPFQAPATPACQSSNFPACQASLSRFHLRDLISYEPASHFWEFQWVETGIFLAMALVLAGLCVWWLIRRVA